MKSKIALLISAALIIISSAFTVVVHKTGQVLATGSPYDQGSCTACHSGGSTVPTISVTANPAFGVGNTYMPGATYTINVAVAGSYTVFGFDMEILDSNSPVTVNDAGVMGASLSGNCATYTLSGNPTNVTHTAPSGSSGAALFSFLWTAPNSGDVYMYTAGVGANNNNSKTGDRVATYSLVLNSSIGVEERPDRNISMSVFPNPVQDKLRISYFAEEKGNVSIRLCNSSGQIICELLKAYSFGGPQSCELSLPEGITPGIYLIQLKLDHAESFKKLVLH